MQIASTLTSDIRAYTEDGRKADTENQLRTFHRSHIRSWSVL